MKENILQVFSTCIPVKGIIRSIIYDLGRSDYLFIPNDLCELLFFLQSDKRSITDFRNKATLLGIENTDIEEYLNFLLEHEIVFNIPKTLSPNLPAISKNWDFPSKISSFVVICNNFLLNDVNNIVHQIITNTSCEHISFFCKEAISYEDTVALLNQFKNSRVRTIELICNYSNWIENNKFRDNILMNFVKVKSLSLFNSPRNEAISENNIIPRYFLFKDTLQDLMKDKVDFGYFKVNPSLYSENLYYNSYYNRKIFVSSFGDIFLSKKLETKLGSIYDKDWQHSIFKNEKLLKLWFAKKDEIDVCKNCEFRYMCSDSRIPHQRKNGTFFHVKECNYNPFIAKWQGEEGYSSISKISVLTDKKQFVVDETKYQKVLQQTYT